MGGIHESLGHLEEQAKDWTARKERQDVAWQLQEQEHEGLKAMIASSMGVLSLVADTKSSGGDSARCNLMQSRDMFFETIDCWKIGLPLQHHDDDDGAINKIQIFALSAYWETLWSVVKPDFEWRWDETDRVWRSALAEHRRIQETAMVLLGKQPPDHVPKFDDDVIESPAISAGRSSSKKTKTLKHQYVS